MTRQNSGRQDTDDIDHSGISEILGEKFFWILRPGHGLVTTPAIPEKLLAKGCTVRLDNVL